MLEKLKSRGAPALIFYTLGILFICVTFPYVVKTAQHNMDLAVDLAESFACIFFILFGIGLSCDDTLNPKFPLS